MITNMGLNSNEHDLENIKDAIDQDNKKIINVSDNVERISVHDLDESSSESSIMGSL